MFIQHGPRRAFEADQHLGRSDGKALADTHVNGTPAQRGVSMENLTAANVSTCESGATPGSWR